MDEKEEIAFSRSGDLPFLELQSVRHTRRHFSAFHETYTICMNLTAGGAEWLYRGRMHSGHGRMLMLMEPGEAHRTVRLLGATGSFRVLYIEPGWLSRLALDEGMRTPHFTSAMTLRPQAHQALAALCRSMDAGESLLERQTRLIAFLQAILDEAPRRCGPSARPGANLLRARDYLVDNCDSRIVLDDLAQASGLSKFHLVRAFSRTFGMTPHVFLNHVRVSRARRLLRSGTPADGSGLGFFDQSHFIGVFRSAMGVTPGRYAACHPGA